MIDRPKTGGRVLLDRDGDGADPIRYVAVLSTPTEDWRGAATIAAAGDVTFSWESGEPPEWLVAFARAFLRSQWKSGSWPSRINRWRDAPREA
jgi:hypothetical protein